MATSYINVFEVYNFIINTSPDPRTSEWPLVCSPWTPVIAVVVFLYFCWNARKFTAKMPNYRIRGLLIAYNAVLVALSAYMMYEFFVTAYLSKYNVICEEVNQSENGLPRRMANVCWLYYASKYVELLETVMFSVRKKYSQITFLHVYHHSSMICLWWLFVKYSPGGTAYVFGGTNSFVHTVMYTYYGLSAIGPHMQKYLWWKKYITVLQLIQFGVLFAWCSTMIATDCNFSPWITKMCLLYSITLLILFLNFFFQTYVFRKAKKAQPPQGKRD